MSPIEELEKARAAAKNIIDQSKYPDLADCSKLSVERYFLPIYLAESQRARTKGESMTLTAINQLMINHLIPELARISKVPCPLSEHQLKVTAHKAYFGFSSRPKLGPLVLEWIRIAPMLHSIIDAINKAYR